MRRFSARPLLVASVGVAAIAYACGNEVVGNFVGGPGIPPDDAAEEPHELIPFDGGTDAVADATIADADAD